MTFVEYVKSLKVGYLSKKWGAMIGAANLSAIAITFGVSLPGITYHNPLFLLMFIGVPPLILYALYCDKKYWGDIK